jgi:hypothetical protein
MDKLLPQLSYREAENYDAGYKAPRYKDAMRAVNTKRVAKYTKNSFAPKAFLTA